jgi:hypothetical protein
VSKVVDYEALKARLEKLIADFDEEVDTLIATDEIECIEDIRYNEGVRYGLACAIDEMGMEQFIIDTDDGVSNG